MKTKYLVLALVIATVLFSPMAMQISSQTLREARVLSTPQSVNITEPNNHVWLDGLVDVNVSYVAGSSYNPTTGQLIFYKVSWISIKIDGTEVLNETGSQLSNSYSGTITYVWNTTQYSDGTHTILTMMENDFNAVVEDEHNDERVDNTPPTVSITFPSNNTYVRQTVTVQVSASDSDSGVSKVEFYLDDSLQYTDTTSPYEWSWDTTQSSDGTHTVKVVAYDGFNNSNTTINDYIVDNTPPTFSASASLTYFSPNGDGYADTDTISAQTTDGSTANWYLIIQNSNGNTVRTHNPSDGSSFSWTWDGKDSSGVVLPDGSYNVVIYAEDNANNNNSQAITIYIDNTPPNSFSKSSIDGMGGNNTVLADTSPTFYWSNSPTDDLSGTHAIHLYISKVPDISQNIYNYQLSVGTTSYKIPVTLSDGTYYWWVVAIDNALNGRLADGGALWNGTGWVTHSDYWVFTVDTTPPNITPATATPYWYSPNSDGFHDVLYINATSDESVDWTADIHYANNNSWVMGVGTMNNVFSISFIFSTLLPIDTQYYVNITASDEVGNVNYTHLFFVQDTTPMPSPTPYAPLDNSYLNTSKVVFSWSVPPANTTLNNWWKDVLYVFDVSGSVVFTATIYNHSATASTTLADGVYHYEIVRYDSAGNKNSTNYVYFTVDTTPSTAPTLQSPQDNTITNASRVNFTWLPSSDATAITYRLVIGFYGTTTEYLNVSTSNSWYVVNFSSVVKQEFWWYVIAYDSAGHHNKSADTFYLTIDHEPPKISMSVSSHYMSPNGNGVKDNITINGTSLIGGDPYKWEVQIINSSGAVVKSHITFSYSLTFSWKWDGTDNSGNVVSDGNYTIILIAYDTAGNQNRTASWVVVDTIPPSNPELLTPAEGSYLNHAWANITWNWTDTNITQAKIHVLNSTGEYYSVDISLTDTYLNISLPDGSYSVYVEVWDVAGNENITPYRNFVIDTTPPASFSLISPSGVYESAENVTLTWSASTDINFDHYIVVVYYNGTYRNYTATAPNYVVTLPAGEYAVDWYVIAMDKAGNSRESNETYTFYHDTIAPRGIYLEYPATNSILNNMTINFTWSYAVDFSAVHYIFEIYSASGSVIYSNTTNNNYTTAVVANGNFSWRVIAVDEAGNQNATANSQFVVNTVPPWIEATALNSTMINGNITVGDNITLNITTNGVQMRIVSGSYDSGWIDYSQYFTLPFSTTGLYNITVYVRDRAGNYNSTSLTVYLDASPPVIDSIDMQHYISFTTSESVVVNATDDTEIKEYGYEINGSTFWFSTSQFTINPTSGEGNYTITILVKDIFNHTTTLTTWIYEIQHKPTGSISVNTHLTNNATVSFNLNGNDTVFNIVGMYIMVDNGNWQYYTYSTSMQITFTVDGNHTVYVKFVNDKGVESDIYSTWVVVDTAPPITSISGIPAYTNSTSITFTVIGNDSLSGLAYFKVYYRVNGGAWTFFNTYLANQTSITFTFSQAGTYEFAILGYDKAGNHEDTSVKATAIVDWTKPTLVVKSQSTTLTPTFNYTLYWNATDNTGIAYYLIVIYKGQMKAGAWKIINTTNTSVMITFDDNATYIIEIYAYDLAGNFVEKSLTITENYNYPPEITKTDIPTNTTAGQETTFYADAVDVKGDNLNYTWILDNKTVGYGQYLKIKLPKGNHTLELIVSDGVHNVTRTWNITVKPASKSGGIRRVSGNIMDLLIPILLLILLLIVVLIVFMMIMKRRKPEEKEEGLSEEELTLLNGVKEYLEKHNGEKIDTVVNVVSKKLGVEDKDIHMIIDIGETKGIFTRETDADGNVRIYLATHNIEVEKKGV